MTKNSAKWILGAAILVLLLCIGAAAVTASPSCMTVAEARATFPADHLWWHGSGHCWDNQRGGGGVKSDRLPRVAVDQYLAQRTVAHARAQARGRLADRSNPGFGRKNSLRLGAPPLDPNGNIAHRNIVVLNPDTFNEIDAQADQSPVVIYPTLMPGPPVDVALLLPRPSKAGPVLIDIDVMAVFEPWEFRVAGAFGSGR